jgi:hypothetical protein
MSATFPIVIANTYDFWDRNVAAREPKLTGSPTTHKLNGTVELTTSPDASFGTAAP